MLKAKVLLIDDEEEFTLALSERMQARGINTVTASNGDKALNMVETEKFDAVILDMVMPGMDGIETMKRLLEKNPQMQIILLTGHATVQKSIEALKLGATDFLEKPAEINQLVQKVKDASARRIAVTNQQSEKMIKDILISKGW
jgi:DNA-binding NtrC family response regulator